MELIRRTMGRIFGGHASVASLVEEIKGLQNLEEGWNSHHAPRISASAIKHALEIVDMVTRKHMALPSAAPTPLGGVALSWEMGDLEAQLLIDDESFDYSVGRRAHPKVIDQGSTLKVRDLEARFIDKYLAHPA